MTDVWTWDPISTTQDKEVDEVPRRETAREQQPLELGGLRLRPRWRVRRIALLSALIFAGSALIPMVVSMLLPPVYGGQLELLLKPRPEVSDTAVERAMLTEEIILTSPTVLGPVAARAGLPLESLQSAVETTMVGRSNVLRLTVADQNQNRALNLVRAIEQEYASVHAAAASSTDTPTLTYTTLTAARLLDEPVAPRPLRALAAGALVGLLAASGVALLLLRPIVFGRPPPRQ